ncbi:MAG: Fe-S cluster assembly protein SufD [Acidimicrobiia bacterium]
MTDTRTIGASDTEWMAKRRKDAASALPDITMPSEREEIWRYLDLDFDPAFESAPTEPGDSVLQDEIVAGWTGNVVTVVDGFVTTDGLETLSASDGPLGSDRDTDLFATAHRALSPGAVVIDREMLNEPVLVDVQTTGANTTFPGVHVDVEPGSSGTVIVRYRSGTSEPATVVPILTANVGDNGRLALTVVQDWNYGTRAFGRAIATLGRDASLVLSEIGLGARLGRLHLDVDFVGNGSNAKIYGAYFGEEDQTLDYRYFMNHIGTNTRCDMFLKGAVEDRALSVFTGMIRIEESGQKTESFQTNKNLILSDGAAAQSVPNLEILANDVKCGHGSSVGPLDQDQKYYLMARGLTSERADRLQVHGFFEEVVSQLPDPAVAAWVRDRINHKYIAAQEEGRV